MTARIEQTLDKQKDLAVVTVIGDVSADQVKRQILSFLADKPTQRVLWDFQGGSLMNLSQEDMQQILAEGAELSEKRRGGRTAIVCTQTVDFGLARMFESLASCYHLPFEIQVFKDRNAAMSWLEASAERVAAGADLSPS